MSQVTPAMRVLARRLLVIEARNRDESDDAAVSGEAALRVFEKMRVHLTKLIGVTGYQALVARALALARTNLPSLGGTVRVTADGALARGDAAAEGRTADEAAEGYGEILTHLLSLLTAFVGGDLTLRLMRDVWSEASLSEKDSDAEETSQ